RRHGRTASRPLDSGWPPRRRLLPVSQPARRCPAPRLEARPAPGGSERKSARRPLLALAGRPEAPDLEPVAREPDLRLLRGAPGAVLRKGRRGRHLHLAFFRRGLRHSARPALARPGYLLC